MSNRVLPDGVKVTTGGTFDPDEPMPYFIASSPSTCAAAPQEHILVAVNELRNKTEMNSLESAIADGKKVMLDSGIFNLASEHARAHNVTHDEALSMAPEDIDGFDRLWEDYGNIVADYSDKLWGVVELDQGGVKNKPRTRARIEREFGITPIPVYHPLLDGWDYYDELAQNYDRMCFGNIVQASPPLRMRLAHTAYERAKKYPYLWTHLLGMTPNQKALSIQMRGSMDSSSWLAPARWMPSWRSPAMLKASAKMPPSMWLHSGTDKGGYQRNKLEAVCGIQADSINRTMRHISRERNEVMRND